MRTRKVIKIGGNRDALDRTPAVETPVPSDPSVDKRRAEEHTTILTRRSVETGRLRRRQPLKPLGTPRVRGLTRYEGNYTTFDYLVSKNDSDASKSSQGHGNSRTRSSDGPQSSNQSGQSSNGSQSSNQGAQSSNGSQSPNQGGQSSNGSQSSNQSGQSSNGAQSSNQGSQNSNGSQSSNQGAQNSGQGAQRTTLLVDELDINLQAIKSKIGKSSDVIFRPFRLRDGRDACLIYIDGLSDATLLDEEIIKPLIEDTNITRPQRHARIDEIEYELVSTTSVKRAPTLEEALKMVVGAMQVVLLVDGERVALALNVGGGENRAISEPDTESVVRGPREGFNESLRTSLTLIRRRIRSTDLVIETKQIGTYTQTMTAIIYIEGIVNPSLVDEMHQRLNRIDTDSVIDSGYIEEFIEDDAYSPFPQIQNTERPDVVAAALVEGRIAIMTDGSPFALIAPVNLWSAFQASEDYYERFPIANLIRWLRYMFVFIALYLPSLYVAITTFHQEMLPTKMLLSVAAAREVTPLPAIAECLVMEVTFEALREAGIRLPKTVGSAISIVGALVIGQAAVEAGIVSAPMVIVVAITGIASFVIPHYSFAIAIRMLRFAMIILGGTIGLFGIVLFTLAVVIHLSGLRSLGVPYLTPVTPFHSKNFGDIFVRAPHWAMRRRPIQTSKQNLTRQTAAMAPNNRVPKNKRRS